MKNLLFSLILGFFALNLLANDSIYFKFAANTIEEGKLKNKMETNISRLLTEINRAGSEGDSLNLADIDMENGAKKRLDALWDASGFVCDRTTNIAKCLIDFQGYQVRGIPVTMKPNDSTYNESLNREFTISLNKQGEITGVRPAWELNEDITKILTTTGTGGVMESRMRREILKWIEDYKTLYNGKDLKGIEDVLSKGVCPEDAMVNKNQWINGLKCMLERNNFSTEIDLISVLKHGGVANIFGLTFHQIVRCANYEDAGWFFLMMDFNNPDRMEIRICTYQPDEVVAKEGVFTLDDFYIR